MTTPTRPAASIQVSVTINAEPETVWRFLSEPDKVLAWMTFIPGAPTPPGSQFETRPGGAVRIIFPNGGEAKGQVVELVERKRLVFTWGYDPDVANTGLAPGSCRIEIAMLPVPEGTRITLTHSGPMSDEIAKGHQSGWRHYLSQLAVHASAAYHTAHLDRTLAAYFDACNQPDDDARASLLETCCEPDIRIRTPFASADTLSDFSAHIANGLRHMRGARSVQAGPPRHIHGFARVPWTVTGPDGRDWFKGENLLRLSPRGRIAEIVSFHADAPPPTA